MYDIVANINRNALEAVILKRRYSMKRVLVRQGRRPLLTVSFHFFIRENSFPEIFFYDGNAWVHIKRGEYRDTEIVLQSVSL